MTSERIGNINIVLTGFMGSGKTTVGRLLAERLGRRFVDTDHLIETWAGESIATIFARRGEAAFREWELFAAETLAEPQALVIATGGGMVTNPACVALLQQGGTIIALGATPATIVARVGASDRPLLQVADPAARVQTLLAARAATYAQFPQVNTDGCDPHAVVDAVLALLTADDQ